LRLDCTFCRRRFIGRFAQSESFQIVFSRHIGGSALKKALVNMLARPQEQVDDVVRRADGIAAGAGDELTVIDCTTSAPATLRTLARDYPSITFVDAPLGRAPKEAWAGELSVMVGPHPDTLEKIRPVLSAFATTIQHAGPSGSGHTLKLINNILSLGYGALHAEAADFP
jgi:3-hydroxyisobutyrate dehydrogenase-like beta-hydroxyacid dehydrogenase